MTTGQIVVITLRIVVPLLILKRPLAGTIIAFLLDAFDVVIVEFFGPGGMGDHYHTIDKVLDTWYLALAAWVSLGWEEAVPRLISIWLFIIRMAGVVIFSLTGWRWVLFVFPNLFENWFLFYLIRNRFFPRIPLETWRQYAFWLVILYIPKAVQEYILHIAQAQPWDWFKRQMGW